MQPAKGHSRVKHGLRSGEDGVKDGRFLRSQV